MERIMQIYEKALTLVNDKKGDAVLILNRYNMRYITGYTGDTGIVYLSDTTRAVLTDFRYIYQVQAEAKEFEAIDVGQKGGYAKAVAELVRQDKAQVLLFEGSEMIYDNYESYRTELTGCELVAIGSELEELRMVKTAQELEYVKMAEHIGDLAFHEILNFIQPGITELEIAAKLEYTMKMQGAEGLSFSAIVASGVNSSFPHAVPSRKKVEKGDFLTMDFGCIYQGYCSDMTRTIVVGSANEKQKEIYSVVLEAQLAVLSELKAGMTGKAIDKIARDIITKAGYGDCFGHGLGHSVGLYIHELPRASASYEKTVEAGMTMTVEPGIYIKDFGGVRIEDLVVVTENGCENFTHSPKELIEL